MLNCRIWFYKNKYEKERQMFMTFFKDLVVLSKKKYYVILLTWSFSLIVNIIITILSNRALDVVKGYALSSLIGSFITPSLISLVLLIQLFNSICPPKLLRGFIFFFKFYFIILIVLGIIFFINYGLFITTIGIAGYLGIINFTLKSNQVK